MAKAQRIEVSPGDEVLIVLADDRGLRVNVKRESFHVIGTHPDSDGKWACTATMTADSWPDAIFRIVEEQ